MSALTGRQECEHAERVALYALGALAEPEARALEAHVAVCAACRADLDGIGPAIDALAEWPTDVLRAPRPLWDRVAARVAAETGGAPLPAAPAQWTEPEWREVAPGISCKLLANDRERNIVSMLVRLAPGTEYPPHRHGGVEELHLLDGILQVDARTLRPGDYLRSEPATADALVYSETGCTCVLVTSVDDELR